MNNMSIAYTPAIKSKTTAALVAFVAGFAFCSATPLPLHAQQDSVGTDLPLVPLVPPDPVDFSGLWDYRTGQPSVSGRCPAGSALRGQLLIAYDYDVPENPENLMEGPVTVDILSGSVCDPASLCHLGGVISGTGIAVGASAIVDDEHGEAIVAWSLWFESDKIGGGGATSNYTHPEGFSCDWAMDVRLTRPED